MKSRYKMQGESMKSYFGRCLADAEEQLADAKRWKDLFEHIEHNLPMCNALVKQAEYEVLVYSSICEKL